MRWSLLERGDGGRTGVLIEWKFTENYGEAKPFKSERGTDRREIYRARYEGATTPFIADKPPIDTYFHEPHYQLLRLSLLAEGMREAGEHGVDRMVDARHRVGDESSADGMCARCAETVRKHCRCSVAHAPARTPGAVRVAGLGRVADRYA